MLSIGEFSKLCQVTTKTLRYYDNVNLIKPVHNNPETGYRYYDVSQLKDMLTVLRLKQYGFTLEEISQLLHAQAEELIRSMEKKLAEQTAFLNTQQMLLGQLKKDITYLEKGFNIMQYNNINIQLVQTNDENIISIRDVIAIRNFDQLFGKVYQLMQETGAICAGAPFAIYHCAEFDPEHTDVEVGFPTTASNQHTRPLPGGTCVMGTHKGEYSTLTQTYTMLAEWIEKEGYTISAPPYEKYLNDPADVSPDQLITEIYFPIVKK